MDSQTAAGHQRIAGLDGLRGLAVTLVLGFHLYPRLIPGGWLGVSLFFTLSGFLITTVILRDRDNDTFTFTSFYARRARRLLPAAFLVLALFTITWTLFGWFDTNHRKDVFFSMLQIANWQQIWEGIPYGTALASPVVHYWSLAIEEQAYLALPLLIVVAGRRRLPIIAALLFAISTAATFFADANQSVIYFGTHTRAAEILAGVIIAAVIHNTKKTPHRRVATMVSSAGLVYLVAASVVVHLNDDVVYSGGLIITGIVSAAVIATIPHTHIASLFNATPLVWLGTVSYGIYLIHWPVLQTLKRTDLPQWSISPLTLLITFIAAQVMYRFYETPIRLSFSVRKAFFSVMTITVLTAGVSVTAQNAPSTFEEIQDQIETSPTIPIPATSTAPRIFYFGDSKMVHFYKSLQNRLLTKSSEEIKTERFTISGSFTRVGCPIGYLGEMMNGDRVQKVGDGCNWSVYDSERQPSDIAVIWAGTWDTADRRIEELFGKRWVSLKDSDYRAWIREQYLLLFDHLRSTRGITQIVLVNYLGITMEDRQPQYDDLLESLSSDNGVTFLNLSEYLQDKEILDYFPDGSHVSIGEPTEVSKSNDNSGAELYEKWFEPVLCSIIQKRAPELLTGVTCSTVDNSPRKND